MSKNVKLIQYLDQHWYKVHVEDNDIRYLASVTTKQGIEDKPFLARWRGDVSNREADLKMFESQMRGTRIHAAWEAMQLGKEVIYDPSSYFSVAESSVTLTHQDEMIACHKLQQAYEELKPEVLEVEKIVYSLKYSYAGTVDSVWRIKPGKYKIAGAKSVELKGGVYVIDLKTGKSISNGAYEQTSAYAWAFMEMKEYYDISGTMIFHTQAKTKSGIEGFTAALRDDTEYPKDFQKFQLVSKLFDMRNKGAGPRIAKFPSNIKLEGITPQSVKPQKEK